MGLELYMVGMVTRDLGTSLEFYRRLGVAVPNDTEGKKHVGIKMESGVTFFLNAPESMGASERRVIFEFYLPSREIVDAKYAELTGFGYQSHRTPYFETAADTYFAMVNDPDGNIVLLSAA